MRRARQSSQRKKQLKIKDSIEKRFAKVSVRVAETEGGQGKTLSGLAIPYNSPSVLIDEEDTQFTEVILPGAFDDYVNNPEAEIMMLYSHDWESPLARRSAGRLSLSSESDGVHFTATPPDTTRAQDLVKDIEAGNVQGVSFGFTATEDRWSNTAEGLPLREVVKGILYEISPVVNPAYPDTAIASRSLKLFQKRGRKEQTSNALRAARLRLLKAKTTTIK